VKANISGEFTVVNSYLVDDLKKLDLWDEEMLERIKYCDGNVGLIEGLPAKLQEKYKEAFEVDPLWCIKLTAARSKWIDQSQSHNVFAKGTSGKLLSDIYMAAWRSGLKTTYYLRSLAASQIEKSTVNAAKYGYTQKREYGSIAAAEEAVPAAVTVEAAGEAATGAAEIAPAGTEPALCRIDDPECESCQ